jgi:hypothetical protein
VLAEPDHDDRGRKEDRQADAQLLESPNAEDRSEDEERDTGQADGPASRCRH